jgi:transcriptional regulator with XRE-family HTH domain
MGLGLQLQQVRQEQGLTREALAERVGAGNAKTVWAYERGGKDMRIATLRRYAEALGVTPGRLLEEGQA